MSTPPASTPSPSELENLGVIFAGFVATTVLYGLTFFQTYIYYTRYPKDSKWIKYLVAVLCTLDTTASALVSEVLYYYLIILFDVDMSILHATTTFCVQYTLSVILTFISSLFFIYRVFQVTRGSKPVTLVLIFLSCVSLAFGLTASVQMYVERRLPAFGTLHMAITAAMNQATGLLVDMIVFATMCYSLRRARFPEIAIPDGCLQTVVKLFVGRGLAFTIVQAGYFAVFVAAPSRPFWIPLQMVTTKFCVNTVLGHLNSRESRRGHGLNEEESFVDRKTVTVGRLPTSIRLNVTDAKANQSVSLSTQPETESGGSGQESQDQRKTYLDSHAHEYTQVSTASSQSQTSNEEAIKTHLSEPYS